MEKQQVMSMLEQGLVRVVFQKKATGERREMRATLHPSILPPAPPKDPNKVPRKYPENLIVCWDLEAASFRTFDPADLLEEPVTLENYSA